MRPRETSACSMFTAMSGSTSWTARRNSAQNAVSWPSPNATKSQADSVGLRGRVEHERAKVAHHGDRVHLLPEEVARIEFDANVGGPYAFDKFADGCSGFLLQLGPAISTPVSANWAR